MPTLTADQIYEVCLQAGFTPDQAVTWTAIALAESGGDSAAHNPRGEDSWGLWQINVDPDVRSNDWGDLTDPLANARAAYEVSGGGTNLRPWTVTHASNEGTGRDYRNFMDDARAAAGGAHAGDFSGVTGYHDRSPGDAVDPPAAAPTLLAPPVAPTVGLDTDGDGALDAFEMSSGTDPHRPDSDADGLTDGFELLSGSNARVADSDDDGLSDGRELELGTDLHRPDSDADAMTDAMELAAGRDPLLADPIGPSEPPATPSPDADDDGLSDAREGSLGTDPTRADSDGDGLSDALELAGGSDPLLAETDGHGAPDGLAADDVLPHAGDPGLALPLAPSPAPLVAPAPAAAPPEGGTAQQFLDAAVAQAGDPYVFGAEATPDDADPDVFDCSELTQWAAAQVGVDLPDGSWLQYLELQERGAVVPVEEALRTPGALLFDFDTEPTPGGGRPGSAHVAISLGDGQTIEARGRRYGVGTWEAGDRFAYAAVLPELSGTATAPTAEALAGLPGLGGPPSVPLDSDADGVTDVYEMSTGTNPYLGDSDGDGLTDGFEAMAGTNHAVADSDGDGLSDTLEMAAAAHTAGGTALPPDGALAVVDSDGDGLGDAWEASLGTDAHDPDTDHDGLLDALELAHGSDAHDPDTDHDGLLDPLDDD